jgi:hypothetical protein
MCCREDRMRRRSRVIKREIALFRGFRHRFDHQIVAAPRPGASRRRAVGSRRPRVAASICPWPASVEAGARIDAARGAGALAPNTRPNSRSRRGLRVPYSIVPADHGERLDRHGIVLSRPSAAGSRKRQLRLDSRHGPAERADVMARDDRGSRVVCSYCCRTRREIVKSLHCPTVGLRPRARVDGSEAGLIRSWRRCERARPV